MDAMLKSMKQVDGNWEDGSGISRGAPPIAKLRGLKRASMCDGWDEAKAYMATVKSTFRPCQRSRQTANVCKQTT